MKRVLMAICAVIVLIFVSTNIAIAESSKDSTTAQDSVKTEVTKDSPDSSKVLSAKLFQNQPNPFIEGTFIGYFLPEKDRVLLEVFNVVGQPISILVDTTKAEGYHKVWWKSSDMPSGIYFYRLSIGDCKEPHFAETKKMVLLR